jgi:hypothetical protein
MILSVHLVGELKGFSIMINKTIFLFILLIAVVSSFAENQQNNVAKYNQPGMSDMMQEDDFFSKDDTSKAQYVVKELDLGFVFNSFKIEDYGSRISCMAPFYESITFPNESKFWAIRPLYSYSYNAKNDRTIRDILWPLVSDKIFNNQRMTRILLYYNLDYDTTDYKSDYAASVFPLLFWGRNRQGNPYFAAVPFGGTIDNFLGSDEAEFILFPLYSKYRTGKMTSTNFLWPIFNYTSGPGVERYRVWPLYGRNINEDIWAKHFVLWPIWTDVTYHLEGAKGYSFILFPLYGQTRTQNQSTTWVFPPLFRFSFSEPQTMIYCPWPFFQYMKGDWNKLYFWPIWGTKEYAGVRRDFYLWPLMSRRYTQRPTMIQSSFQFIPFFYYENRMEVERKITSVFNEETKDISKLDYSKYPVINSESMSKYVKIWPVFSYRRLDDNYSVRVLDLWPGRSWPALERNYSPFWTVYSHYKLDNVHSDTLLWGLWRYRSIEDYKSASIFPLYNQVRDTDSFRWNFLYGLFGYNREKETKHVKLLYLIKFPFGEQKEQNNK